jgi:hypothetical protein
MVPSGLLNVSQASANSATSPSVLVKGVPSIASAIASDGNGLLDVGVTHGVVCVSNGGFVLCDHDEDQGLLRRPAPAESPGQFRLGQACQRC